MSAATAASSGPSTRRGSAPAMARAARSPEDRGRGWFPMLKADRPPGRWVVVGSGPDSGVRARVVEGAVRADLRQVGAGLAAGQRGLHRAALLALLLLPALSGLLRGLVVLLAGEAVDPVVDLPGDRRGGLTAGAALRDEDHHGQPRVVGRRVGGEPGGGLAAHRRGGTGLARD